jgi:hypothetical protein
MKKILLITIILISATFVNAQDTIYQGTCGENLTWVLTSDSVLTISGSGEMEDYLQQASPWYPYREYVKTLIIGNSVTSIGNCAFGWCSNLDGTLVIPNSVIKIGERAFVVCTNLIGVLNIPSSVTTIREMAFGGCMGLTSITVDDNNPRYSADNGILYSKQQDTLVFCLTGKTGIFTTPNSVVSIGKWAFINCDLTSVIIGNSVKTIDDYSFYGCKLASVIIGNFVTTIGRSAFNYCRNLTSLTMGNSVTTIEYSAFGDCSSLGLVKIPNSVTTIESYAFTNCDSLTSVIIGNSVDTIHYDAFSNCDNLAEITSYSIVPPVSDIYGCAFPNIPTDIPIYVPCGYVSIYQGASCWNSFTNYHTMNPTTPDDINIQQQNNNFIISWQGNGSSFEILRNNQLLTTITQTTFIDNNLETDTEYCYEVKALNGNCESELSQDVCKIYNEASVNQQEITNLKIYPNPTKDKFIIDYDKSFVIKLYDILGKEILTQNINGKTEINISHLPNGIYSVRVISKEGAIRNGKVVKQ